MRRLPIRALAMFGALWTIMSSSSPVPLHPCPEGSRPVDAGMATAGHEHHATDGETHDNGAMLDCECIDCCCLSTPKDLASAPAILTVEAVEHAGPAPTTARASAVGNVALELPFANGPPAAIG